MALNRFRTSTPEASSRAKNSSWLFADAAAGRWSDAARVRDQLRALAPNDAAFADLVYGEPEHLARLLSTVEGQREFIGAGGILGCDPLLDPLWSDARFREAMRKLTVAA